MLSLRDSSACVHEYQICTRAGDQIVLLKYQISGLGVTHAFRERRKKLERKRERQSVVAPHANFARGREKREKERAVLIMKKSSGSSFQNLQGTNTLRRLVKEWCRCCVLLQRRENTGIVLPRQTITFSTIGGSSFSSRLLLRARGVLFPSFRVRAQTAQTMTTHPFKYFSFFITLRVLQSSSRLEKQPPKNPRAHFPRIRTKANRTWNASSSARTSYR